MLHSHSTWHSLDTLARVHSHRSSVCVALGNESNFNVMCKMLKKMTKMIEQGCFRPQDNSYAASSFLTVLDFPSLL